MNGRVKWTSLLPVGKHLTHQCEWNVWSSLTMIAENCIDIGVWTSYMLDSCLVNCAIWPINIKIALILNLDYLIQDFWLLLPLPVQELWPIVVSLFLNQPSSAKLDFRRWLQTNRSQLYQWRHQPSLLCHDTYDSSLQGFYKTVEFENKNNKNTKF